MEPDAWLCSRTAALVLLFSVDYMGFCWNVDHIISAILMERGFIMTIPEADRVFKNLPKENRKLPKRSGQLWSNSWLFCLKPRKAPFRTLIDQN